MRNGVGTGGNAEAILWTDRRTATFPPATWDEVWNRIAAAHRFEDEPEALSPEDQDRIQRRLDRYVAKAP